MYREYKNIAFVTLHVLQLKQFHCGYSIKNKLAGTQLGNGVFYFHHTLRSSPFGSVTNVIFWWSKIFIPYSKRFLSRLLLGLKFFPRFFLVFYRKSKNINICKKIAKKTRRAQRKICQTVLASELVIVIDLGYGCLSCNNSLHLFWQTKATLKNGEKGSVFYVFLFIKSTA